MDSLQSRLKKLMGSRRISESELARQTGIAQPVINRMLSGITINPRIETLRPIAKYFEIDMGQLVGDCPLPLSEQFHTQYRPRTIKILQWDDVEVWCKSPESISEFRFYFWYENVCSANAFALQVRDSSMRPAIPENALVVIDPAVTAKDRDFVLVKYQNLQSPSLKQLLYDGDQAYLHSMGLDLPPMLLTNSAEIIGVVLQVRVTFDHK